MDSKKVFNFLAFFIVILAIFNYLADKLHFYYTVWYFDMPMHALGGFCTALLLLWFFMKRGNALVFDLNIVLKILSGVFVVGMMWEFYEIVVNNYAAANPLSPLDIISDIFFDLAGGSVAIFYYFFFGKREITPIEETKV
jgi:hypothetical protein